MSDNLVCWKCGSELVDLIFPLSRREECAVCGVDQHVCKLCKHYDEQVSNQCREDRADFIADKEKANFCDYFAPRPNAYYARDVDAQQEARRQLAELFGDDAPDSDPIDAAVSPLEAADAAKAELERLFGDGGEKKE